MFLYISCFKRRTITTPKLLAIGTKPLHRVGYPTVPVMM
jgi:hypothetical protein